MKTILRKFVVTAGLALFGTALVTPVEAKRLAPAPVVIIINTKPVLSRW